VTVRTVTLTTPVTSTAITGLTQGTTYTFTVASVNIAGTGSFSAPSNAVTAATVPGAPVIGTALRGRGGAPLGVIGNWTAPASNGGLPITNYRVTATRLNANGTLSNVTFSQLVGPAVRTLELTVTAGNYKISVVAINAVGTSTSSAQSNTVAAR